MRRKKKSSGSFRMNHLLYERRKERGNPPASGHLLYERRKKKAKKGIGFLEGAGK